MLGKLLGIPVFLEDTTMGMTPTRDYAEIWERIKKALTSHEIEPTMEAAAKFIGGITRATLKDALKRYYNITSEDLKVFAGYGNNGNPDLDDHEDFEETGNGIKIVSVSTKLKTEEELIAEHKIDMTKWRVKGYHVKTSQGYRKDRTVEWKVENGVVVYGDVRDTGKMLVVTLHHSELLLERRVEEMRAALIVEQMIKDAAVHAPVYQKIAYPKKIGKVMYEIDMPDIHFGRLTWEEESGENYNIQIAEKMVTKVVEDLLTYTELFPVKKILLPIGNDFYNVNSKSNTTVGGTPQQEDTRAAKTFRRGMQLAIKIIETCSQIAPVDVLIIKGNHDEERVFYLGEALHAWFHNNTQVFIDNRAVSRKYYLYGKNLLGFTHGGEFKIDKLPSIMPTEVPELWAKSNYREWHLGHIHHKFEVNEENGVVVRYLRSLVPIDAWTFDKGFVGALKAAESFVWDYNKGLLAQFTSTP
jgi:hypothetical protein